MAVLPKLSLSLCGLNKVTPVLYTLPKIHKAYKDVPPGTPVVSAIGSLTEKISAIIDFFLQPVVCSLSVLARDINGL